MTKYCPGGLTEHICRDGVCIMCGHEYRVVLTAHDATVLREDYERLQAELKLAQGSLIRTTPQRADCYSWMAQWKGDRLGWVSAPGNWVKYEDYMTLWDAYQALRDADKQVLG